MRAIIQDGYGPAERLRLEEISKPVIGDSEVLIRVRAAAVNPGDWAITNGLPYIARPVYGLPRPRTAVRGTDVAGVVEAVGSSVTRFAPGDAVFGWARGSFAEYAVGSEDTLTMKPARLTFEQAAAVPESGQVALQALRDHGRVGPGHRVLINGASGGIGSLAVQIAKSLGAEVTGVTSTGNLDLVRSLGADHVIDYTREDYARPGRRYDLVFQLGGTRSPWDLRRALTAKGTLLSSSGDSHGRWVGPVGRMLQAVALSPFVGQRLVAFLAKPSRQDLEVMRELIESGRVSPVIDRTYPLSETPEAIRHLETGHARGKIVITV